MSTLAAVRLWGRRIGGVVLEDGRGTAVFQYDPAFAASGIQVAPLQMPLRERPYTFPELPARTFHGLPGLLADALPDRFGNALIDAWLARQGRAPGDFNVVERLCYTGTRGMGALEFEPAQGPVATAGEVLEVERLVQIASEILARREGFATSLAGEDQDTAMRQILSVGTSAGGARAKAVIAWNPQTGEIRSGQVDPGAGFEHWLLKFDGVDGNRDRDALADPQGYGAVEYAYSLMARDAGIEMTETRLLEEGGRRHFMTRRFDRTPTGGKLHLQSLGALAHLDFNDPAANSYEQAFLVLRRLDLLGAPVEQLFRRMLFNVVARNQDDHVKNIAFLMDRAGAWRLAPAFDVTYAYRPESEWVGSHQMSVNGRRAGFTVADVERCADVAGLPQGRGRRLLAEITAVVERWRDYAAQAGVTEDHVESIAPALRLRLPEG